MTEQPTLIRQLALEIANDAELQRAVVGAVLMTLPSVMERKLSELYGGGELRLRPPKRRQVDRAARDGRIIAALQSGMTEAAVSVTEACSVRHVFRVKRRLGLRRID